MNPFKSLIRVLEINCISLTTVLKTPQTHSIVKENVLEYKLFSDSVDHINSVCEHKFHNLLYPLHESILLMFLSVKGSTRKTTNFQMLNCSTPHKQIPIKH